MPYHYDKVLQERIWLTEIENKILNTYQFQRLKNIKQNGFAFLNYPDASNSRYDHSIGTLYWVTKLYSSIYDYEGKSILDNEYLLSLRIVALIHDIGHGPFSHALEELIYRNNHILNYEPWNTCIKKYGPRAPHELITLDYVYSDEFKELINNENVVNKIYEIITKKHNLSLLISGDLDADRLDYITRDSHYSGLPFGFNIRVIFNELLDKNLRLDEKNGQTYLMLDINGLPAFEQFILARYCHYKYIAYEPLIQTANLFFITELEELLEKYLENEELTSEFIFEIFKKITDDEMINLNFDNIKNAKFKDAIININRDDYYRKQFTNMNLNIKKLIRSYLRIINLGKTTTYNIIKKGRIVDFKEVEQILKDEFNKNIKLSICMPSALVMNTCVSDKDLDPRYSPSYVYDHSPLIQGLEQKMYQDIGITILSKDKFNIKLVVSKINTLTRGTSDFDYYTFGIINYIKKIPKLFEDNQQKWELKRARIFDYVKYLYNKLNQKGKISNKLNFDIPYYNKDVYDMLQKLEFLDVINEDYNLKHGMGSYIPSYHYSLGEYVETIESIINLLVEDKSIVEEITDEYFYNKRWPWVM